MVEIRTWRIGCARQPRKYYDVSQAIPRSTVYRYSSLSFSCSLQVIGKVERLDYCWLTEVFHPTFSLFFMSISEETPLEEMLYSLPW